MAVDQPSRIGVVGVGAMGAPLVAHLAGAGFEVEILDRDSDAAARVAGETAAVIAPSLEALAGSCACVLVVVDSDAAVRSVIPELLARPDSLRTVLVCSSVQPGTVRELGGQADAAGVALLDVAMTGGIRGIRAGRATALVGGSAGALDTVRPVLAPWTGAVHHLGPLGAGQVAKGANNLIHWAQVCAIEEALRLVHRAGLSVPAVRRALADGPVDSRALHELELMKLTWWRKDLAGYRELADELGAPHTMGDVCAELMPAISVDSLAALLAERRP
jgi:3-hydroxyisobutyrate dehydrogenase-like beta-hydroxyacid dehydrogenase